MHRSIAGQCSPGHLPIWPGHLPNCSFVYFSCYWDGCITYLYKQIIMYDVKHRTTQMVVVILILLVSHSCHFCSRVWTACSSNVKGNLNCIGAKFYASVITLSYLNAYSQM